MKPTFYCTESTTKLMETRHGIAATSEIFNKDDRKIGIVEDFPERIVAPVQFMSMKDKEAFTAEAMEWAKKKKCKGYEVSDYARYLSIHPAK